MSRRSGSRTAEFLMSAGRQCYVAAPGFEGRSPKFIAFEEEPAETQVAARMRRWTPASLDEAQPHA